MNPVVEQQTPRRNNADELQRPRFISSLQSVLFILSWALIFIASFRNSLTW